MSRGAGRNGVDRAKRVKRRESAFRGPPGKNIAAIDFGTKNCSLAYVTEGDTELVGGALPMLPLDGTSVRVPTAILLNSEREVEAFGDSAKAEYREMDHQERERMYYFEGIKMNLRERVNRDMTIAALNGKEFLLVDIITHILCYLKKEFLEHLRRMRCHFVATDFHWVITVPAIWEAGGKQMMREAGYRAGLCSVDVGPPGELPANIFREQLSLALEPECGAIYCHEMRRQRKIAPHCQRTLGPTLPPTYSYLIVDMGGGTVDISAHRVTTDRQLYVEELHKPAGIPTGGAKVNHKFSALLEELVNNRFFTHYLHELRESNPQKWVENRFDLDELINTNFEDHKKRFGAGGKKAKRDVKLTLHESFMDLYGEELKKSVEARGGDSIRFVDGKICISPAKMEEFFTPVIEEVTERVLRLMETLASQKCSIDVIYLVGGFGSTPYVYGKFEETFGDKCEIIVPRSPEHAIVEGAILYRWNPAFVRARKADATYGKSVICPFQRETDDPGKKMVLDKGEEMCRDLFQTIVGVGETVDPDYIFVATCYPLRVDQPTMDIEVFSSQKPVEEIRYTTDEGVEKIGKLTLTVPENVRGEVKITFDFSHSEIQVQAIHKATGDVVSTVLDFLSSQPSRPVS